MNTPPIRVAFTGASGTGKSTLAAYIAEKHNVPQNPVGSRSVSLSMGFASPYDVDAAGKRAEFQRRLLVEKCAWEANTESFVTDRTPLDNLLYTMLHDVSVVNEEMIAVVQRGLLRYTHVIYCPVEAFCHVGEDAARVKSMAYQEVYDAALVGLLDRYMEMPFRTIHQANLELRKQMVDLWVTIPKEVY